MPDTALPPVFPELHFAPGTDLRKLTPQTLLAWQVAAVCYARRGFRALATSVTRPGPFSVVGFHGDGNAIDLGFRGVPREVAAAIAADVDGWIGRRGGGQYDVVFEYDAGSSAGWTGAHLHIEFDPK